MAEKITTKAALLRLRMAGYLVEDMRPTPKKAPVIRFYDDLSRPDILIVNGEVDSAMIDNLCKKSWLNTMLSSMGME
jgi:hypothetical protein